MSEKPIVVVGSGLAGLTCAWAATTPVVLVTAGTLTEGAASMWAQGGIAAAVSPDDSTASHAEDTWRAGAFAGDRPVIDRITGEAPEIVQVLADLDVPFDRASDGSLDLALEGGHSRPRVAHAGDHSGATITASMAAAVLAAADIELRENHTVTKLLTDDSGAVSGVVVRRADGTEETIDTDRVVLATGGLGGLWPHTTNPRTALGQGVALAARAGARTDDLHLVQFHPTGLDVPRDPMPLLTEALRGAGAVLLADGERFTDELQPRDVVAAAVWEQLTHGFAVRLDARGIPDVTTRFPAVAELAAASGLDLANDLLPVRPALHYSMGGVTVDGRSRTSVTGLWAIGEVSRTGLHGANRLASNSLLEAVVTGRAAARDSSAWRTGWDVRLSATDRATVLPRGDAEPIPVQEVRDLLGASCGVLRDGPTLQAAVDALQPHTGDDVAYVAWLIARSALAHPHSVGAHRRTDSVEMQGARV
ncbi:L-aspartate oxidase [Flexivirga oryzae]|uniref:L-aspartate oxidase n=1 Tax=Flexivirga oryzae TaxID=1794944 RepID=A0A839N039_9MICO|nr:FAD-binding protein [Flexivirga oryzae]MBB2891058.1 L-aspartate oxidase [Flexivirga oryzae]